MNLICKCMTTHFHEQDFALSLALNKRLKPTRKCLSKKESNPVTSTRANFTFLRLRQRSHLFSRNTTSVSGLLQQCSVHLSTVMWLASLGSQGMYKPASSPPRRIALWCVACLKQKDGASFAPTFGGAETKISSFDDFTWKEIKNECTVVMCN